MNTTLSSRVLFIENDWHGTDRMRNGEKSVSYRAFVSKIETEFESNNDAATAQHNTQQHPTFIEDEREKKLLSII